MLLFVSRLTRRALLLSAAAPIARGQEIRAYSRIVPDYYRRLAKAAYDSRNAALAKLTTADAVHARQRWARETFWKLVGGKPEPCAPNVRVTGEFERPGYKLEKIVYESQPGLYIPANLYIPSTGPGPFPGVLFQMGHSLNGKGAEPYQKCCQGLARLGYVVLAFDPMGQGERTYYPKPNGTLTRLPSADDEHTLPGKQMLLVGETATRMQTWDAVASLSVLASHPKVDPKRLGSTGQSGGGTLTMFLAAVDDRLAAAAVSSGNSENFACAGFLPPGSVDDAEQNFIGGGPLGFDRWDTFYPMAPKPMWISASTRDFFGTYSPSYLTSGREEFAKLKKVYQVLGKEGNVSWYETYQPHALSKEVRVQVYRYFENRLKGSGKVIDDEPPVKPEAEQDLYAGRSGNVVRDFGSVTPHSLIQKRAATIKPSGDLRAFHSGPVTPLLNVLRSATAEHGRIETLEFRSQPIDVWLPAFAWIPSAPKSVLLIIEPGGRASHWREDDLYPRLAAEGILVVASDLFGLGDLSPEVSPGNPHYEKPHADEDNYAWTGLMLSSSMLQQRIRDLNSAALAIEKYKANGLPIRLAARGHVTVPALFAAAASSTISRLYTSGGLQSFRHLVESEEFNHSFANFYPNLLSITDIPDLQAQLGAKLHQGAWDFENLRRFCL